MIFGLPLISCLITYRVNWISIKCGGVSMLKFMRKIPGGMLLIPMLISALFATFLPDILR